METPERVRDRVLEGDARELLANDRRLAHLDLTLRVDGAVVHVEGEVRDAGEARLLRHTLARLAGVHGVWDFVRTSGAPPPRLVDIGCGSSKQRSDAIGIDRCPTPAVDVVADIEHRLPLADSSVDHVFAIHVLEHVRDLFSLMRELHRVLKPTGVLHVMVPQWRHPNAVRDPTHVRFFAPGTFRHFCQPRPDWRFEPVTLSVTDDTVFADLEPVHDVLSEPRDEVLARFFG